ncbi:MAG: putative membrane protein [Gammaproteobacteria bacterium]|jgi:putative membrane protein
MIVQKHISFVQLIRIIWLELLAILAVATFTVTSLIYFHLGEYAINASIPLVFGTAIAIFLGFRTNSAYERWWEARKLWGAIISDSRNLVRLCNDFLGTANRSDLATHDSVVREICYRQAAWAQLLNRRFKELPLVGVEHLLSDDELAAIDKANDPALMLLSSQGRSVRAALEAGLLDSRQSVLIEETLSRLFDHYGGCQRIKFTVFPVHYSFFTRVFIWIFLFLLGFSLPFHENANYFLIPAIFLIGWVFFMVEGIGSYMQDPFENNRNVIPMDALARMIEINLREMIGDTELPKPVEPIDGALY